jgi:hypothetical protein
MSKPETIKIDDQEYVRKDSIPTITYTPRKEGPWEIGKAYFIRTVTMFIHGTLVDVTPQELVFIKAAWIADTGRFGDFITGKKEPNEVEPFPQDQPVIVGRAALIDAVQRDGHFKVQK